MWFMLVCTCRTAAYIGAGECLSRMGSIGINQRLTGPHRTGSGLRIVELHVERTAHPCDACIVVDDQPTAIVVVRLKLQPLLIGENAVERLPGEIAVDIGEQRARIQRRIARRLVAAVAIRGGSDSAHRFAVQGGGADAAVVARFLRIGGFEQQANIALIIGQLLGDVALDRIRVADIVCGMLDAAARHRNNRRCCNRWCH